jgi:effector-binding domain-containing protein
MFCISAIATGFNCTPVTELHESCGPEISCSPIMNFSRKLAFGLGGPCFLFFAVGVFLPSQAVVEREMLIDAHRATVFALLNDFHQINKWSHWLSGDPNIRLEISGPARGAGASISWSGNIIGRGSQTITASEDLQEVLIQRTLDDLGVIDTSFHLTESDHGTRVIWRYKNDFGLNIFGRYYALLVDGIVGPKYEASLASLKTMAESLPHSDFSDLDVEQILVAPTDIAFKATSSEPLAAAISDELGKAYFDVLSFIDEHGLQEAGAPISISRAFTGSELRFDAGIPVRGVVRDTPDSQDAVQLGRTYGGPVIRAKHSGSYLQLGQTHNKIAAYLAALGIERNGDAWESYVSDPTRTNESDLVTYIFYPIVLRN